MFLSIFAVLSYPCLRFSLSLVLACGLVYILNYFLQLSLSGMPACYLLSSLLSVCACVCQYSPTYICLFLSYPCFDTPHLSTHLVLSYNVLWLSCIVLWWCLDLSTLNLSCCLLARVRPQITVTARTITTPFPFIGLWWSVSRLCLSLVLFWLLSCLSCLVVVFV